MEQTHESSTGIQVSKARWNSKRVFLGLVCLQFLAALGIFLQNLLPFGIGSYWTANDFRYAKAIMWGASVSLLVLLPLLFAWSPRSLLQRATLFLPLTIAWAAANVLLFILDAMMCNGYSVQESFEEAIRNFEMFAQFPTCLIVGFVTIPLAIRAYKGWQVVNSSSEKVISRNERRFEWLVLVVILVLIGISDSLDGVNGMAKVISVAAIVIGGLLSTSAFWLLRDSSKSLLRVLFAAHVLLFIAIPILMVLLANMLMSFAGYELVFLGVLAAATILLLQLVCLRMSGYRMRKMEFENTPVIVEKVVVDPFSD